MRLLPVISTITFLLVYSIYMMCSNTPILFKNFWKSYFYIAVHGLGVSLLLYIAWDADNSIFKLVYYGGIIFLIELMIFNLSIVNKDRISYYEYCTSKVFGIIFTLLILVMLIVIFIIKNFEKISAIWVKLFRML
jgi:hypothetical protein